MNRVKILLAFSISTNLFTAANAVIPLPNCLSDNPHHVYIGPDIFRDHFSIIQRSWLSSYKVESNTMFYGFRAGYEYIKPQTIYGSFEGAHAWGNEVITSAKWHSSYSRSFANAEGRIGYSFKPAQHFLLTPYLGTGGYHFGFNHWSSFDKTWLYAAGGLRSVYSFTSHFDLGINIKGMKALCGNNNAPKGKYNPYNFWGYEIDVPFSWHFGKNLHWDLQFQPYYAKLNTRVNNYIIGGRLLAGYGF